VASFLLGLLAEWFMTILQIEGIMIYCWIAVNYFIKS
jgi:hypothetical protein